MEIIADGNVISLRSDNYIQFFFFVIVQGRTKEFVYNIVCGQ